MRKSSTFIAISACLAMGLTGVGCGDDDGESSAVTSNGGTTNTSNGTSGTSNGTTATSNGTTSNGTTGGTSNGTTGGTSNGTTGNDDIARCESVCATLAACDELEEACGAEFVTMYDASCSAACSDDEEARNNTLALEGLLCSTVAQALIDSDPVFAESCDEVDPDPETIEIEIGSCSEFSECGGDPIGSWAIDEFCFIIDASPDDIPDEDVFPQCDGDRLLLVTDAGGQLDVRDDNTYTLQLGFSNTFTLTVPQSCLPDTTCEEFQEQIRVDAPWVCETGADSCDCVVAEENIDEQVGVWSTEGGFFAMMPDDPEDDPSGFEMCSEGDSFGLFAMDPASGRSFQFEMSRMQAGVPLPIGECSDDFVDCGGDPTGDWDIVEFCSVVEGPPEDAFPDCPDDVLDYGVEITGGASLNGDGTYVFTTIFKNIITLDFPLSCLPEGATCGNFQDGLNEEGGAWMCTLNDDGDACDCGVDTEGEPDISEGDWGVLENVDSNTLEFSGDDDDDGPTRLDFCVGQGTLELRAMSPEGEDSPLQIEFARTTE